MASIYKNGQLVQKMNNAGMQDVHTIIQAGIDPKTGLPLKVIANCDFALKDNLKRQLRVLDEQDAINRYTWYNLPNGLTGQLIERILYYKGQGMFFYMKENGTFYFLPYTLDGTIDVYGRYTGVTPLPFNGQASTTKKDKETPWIQGLTKKPIYDLHLEEVTINDIYDSCFLLSDYSKQISQTVIPRQTLNEPLLDLMAEYMCFERTALLNSTGITGMRVSNQDEYSNVEAASRSINSAAVEGRKFIAINGSIDFQELTGGNIATTQDFLMAYQSLDNYRKSLYGLDNGGMFQKNTYQSVAQTQMNVAGGGSPYQDGLTNRQHFCDCINSVYGLGVWCDTSESAMGADTNFDGTAVDEQDQTGVPGDQPQEVDNV